MSGQIQPTHHCFDDALDFFEEVVGMDKLASCHREYTVVHAVCVAPDGHPFAHAWVEHKGLVWQGGIIDGARVFYARPRAQLGFPVQREVRYTVEQVMELNAKSEHYGPWDADIKALCGAKGTRVIVAAPEPGPGLVFQPPSASPIFKPSKQRA